MIFNAYNDFAMIVNSRIIAFVNIMKHQRRLLIVHMLYLIEAFREICILKIK